MLYSYGKSPFESAAKSSLQSSPFVPEAQPVSVPSGQQQQQSFARNFKSRLYNQPQPDNSKEAAKDAYRRELEKQVQEAKQRKLEQKRRLDEEERKHEREFMEAQQKQKLLAEQAKIAKKLKQQQQQQPQSPQPQLTKGVQKGRARTAEMQYTHPTEQTPSIIFPSPQIPNNPYSTPQQSSLRQLQIQSDNNIRKPFSAFPFDSAAEEQRMITINQFQEAIMKKMDDLRSQIVRSKNSFDTSDQLSKIRAILKSKDTATLRPSVLFEPGQSQANKFYQLKHETTHLKFKDTASPQGTFRKLDAKTEVRYPGDDADLDMEAAAPRVSDNNSSSYNLGMSPINSKPNTPKRMPSEGSVGEQQQQELRDKVQMPQSPPPRFGNFQKKKQPLTNSSSLTHWTLPQQDMSSFNKAEYSKGKPKVIPKNQLADYKIDNMLGNIDTLIDKYDKQ